MQTGACMFTDAVPQNLSYVSKVLWGDLVKALKRKSLGECYVCSVNTSLCPVFVQGQTSF